MDPLPSHLDLYGTKWLGKVAKKRSGLLTPSFPAVILSEKIANLGGVTSW